jgi:hypothetical protein
MDVNTAYKIIQFASAKNTQQGFVSPEDFNTVLMPTAQQQYVDYLLGEFQQYKDRRPIAVVQLGEGEKIRESIAPLIYNTILAPNSTTGIASFPSDYEATDAMWNIYGFYNIRFTNQPRLASFWQSSIDPISSNPVYLLKHEGFQFYPENIGLAKLSYVRRPPAIVWGYVLDSNGIPVYNASTSQQPVWGEVDMMNIISRALLLLGVNLDTSTLVQYANQVKNGGQ